MSPITFRVPGEAGAPVAATLYQAANDRECLGLLVLAHGAGAGDTSPFMVSYATGFAARGVDVVTFNFPYMEARRRSPDKTPVLEEAFRRVIGAAVEHRQVRGPRLFAGGKSMGGRIATHLAAAPEAWPKAPWLSGVVVFGYPLRPPGGQTTSDRVSHLARMQAPALIVQGTRDSFGGPDDLRAALGRTADIAIHSVEGGDHSFKVPKSSGRNQARVHEEILDAATNWMTHANAKRKT
jgi:predicted alpha/beta-hydrolase family hydrolase